MTDKVSVSVKFAGKLRNLASVDRDGIKQTVRELVNRRGRVINKGALSLDITQNSHKFRQTPLFLCRARLWNNGKKVIAIGEEYGIGQTVDRALNKIEQQLIQYKERKLGV